MQVINNTTIEISALEYLKFGTKYFPYIRGRHHSSGLQYVADKLKCKADYYPKGETLAKTKVSLEFQTSEEITYFILKYL